MRFISDNLTKKQKKPLSYLLFCFLNMQIMHNWWLFESRSIINSRFQKGISQKVNMSPPSFLDQE